MIFSASAFVMADKRLWELLAKRYDGQITEEELRELQLLLQERQDTMPYGELLSELRTLAFRPSAEDMAARNKSLSAIMQQVRGTSAPAGEEEHMGGRPGRSRIFAGAAVVLVVAIAAGIVFLKTGTVSDTGAEPYDRIVTKTGSKTLINLPDSSTVVLNSACQFSYNKDFGVRKREMRLTGEAFFDIHSNPDMPLVVHAGNVIIRVLGTAFNVRAYAEDSFVEATLVSGVIEVSLRSDPERKILLRPNEKIFIRNQEMVAAPVTDSGKAKSHDEVIRVTQVEADPKDSSYIETAWLKDKLVFRKESFASLARRMERWYQVHIVFNDTSRQSLLFTGSFEKETVEEALEALRHSAAFGYEINGKTITITRSK
jgi:ferric-dicitrate binding protein FerR (iron transport regulator)